MMEIIEKWATTTVKFRGSSLEASCTDAASIKVLAGEIFKMTPAVMDNRVAAAWSLKRASETMDHLKQEVQTLFPPCE
jgi:hypothetical protein